MSRKTYSPPYVDRIWLWVYYDEIPIYPIFYLLEGDYIQVDSWFTAPVCVL